MLFPGEDGMVATYSSRPSFPLHHFLELYSGVARAGETYTRRLIRAKMAYGVWVQTWRRVSQCDADFPCVAAELSCFGRL